MHVSLLINEVPKSLLFLHRATLSLSNSASRLWLVIETLLRGSVKFDH